MKPTIIDPPITVGDKEEYEGITGFYWQYTSGFLELILNDDELVSEVFDVNERTKEWMIRRIAYLKLKYIVLGEDEDQTINDKTF